MAKNPVSHGQDSWMRTTV